MTDQDSFAPTLAAALERIAAIRPNNYERTRNSLDGGVTRISTYVTHGLVTLPAILRALLSLEPLRVQHKLVFEFGWREYFRHVWQHQGDGIFTSLHPGVLPDADYAQALPVDIRHACTGVPAIDRAVDALYGTGYLHNHARMWLASYVVHVRRVHWRTGADWLYAHLRDGDLASNHLSWQWVAGTGSGKPYLFNADNVARFAPRDWHSPGTVIDASYEALDALARTRAIPPPSNRPVPARPAGGAGVDEPELHGAPPATLRVVSPDAAHVKDRDVWLVHPWALRAPPSDLAPGTLLVGWYDAAFHRRWPWDLTRWQFVGARMAELAPLCWYGEADAAADALRTARSVGLVDDPHVSRHELGKMTRRSAPRLFAEVQTPCASFSKWWTQVSDGIKLAADLPGLRRQES